MNVGRAIMLLAGSMVLLSVVLTIFVSPHFVWLTVFVGLNMMQSSLTGFCPPAAVFRKLGLRRGCAVE